jgi:hypothetical protein
MEYTRPATWDDVKTLARYLDDAAVIEAALKATPERD